MITTRVTTSPENSELVDTESRWFDQLPNSWDTIRLKFLLDDLEQGWSPQCNEVPSSPNEWGVLKTGCVNEITFDSSENKVLPKHLDPKPELEVQNGDVIISRANAQNLVGSCAIARDPDPNLMLSDKLYRLNWDHSTCLPEYLVYALNSSFAREQIDLGSTGFSDSMVNISKKTISNIQIPLPPIKEQQKIVSSLNRSISRNNELQFISSSLIELLEEKRQALITAAVTGQIDVSEEKGVTQGDD
jgi:type I restriction enzyme S subunit